MAVQSLPDEILYRAYISEEIDLPAITALVESELSEPYTVRPSWLLI